MALIALAAVGLLCVVAGVALIFPPAGLIAAGFFFVGVAYLIAEERGK
jgi:hypothetical protein